MIYDTAGQERFNSLTSLYYKKADAILLVYDISEKTSFEKIKSFYVPNIKEICEPGIPILLLGNKTDKEEERQVSLEDGMALALAENYEFNESSCYKNINVIGAFETLIETWNIENHRKSRITNRSNSKGNSKDNFKRNFTENDLDKEIENFKSARYNSFSKIEKDKKEEKNKRKSIELAKDKRKDKKKKKWC